MLEIVIAIVNYYLSLTQYFKFHSNEDKDTNDEKKTSSRKKKLPDAADTNPDVQQPTHAHTDDGAGTTSNLAGKRLIETEDHLITDAGAATSGPRPRNNVNIQPNNSIADNGVSDKSLFHTSCLDEITPKDTQIDAPPHESGDPSAKSSDGQLNLICADTSNLGHTELNSASNKNSTPRDCVSATDNLAQVQDANETIKPADNDDKDELVTKSSNELKSKPDKNDLNLTHIPNLRTDKIHENGSNTLGMEAKPTIEESTGAKILTSKKNTGFPQFYFPTCCVFDHTFYNLIVYICKYQLTLFRHD